MFSLNLSMMKKIILLFALCVGFINSNFAQTDSINIVSTAVPFLRISPDARAGGMGDAAIATAPEANAVFLINSLLSFIA